MLIRHLGNYWQEKCVLIYKKSRSLSETRVVADISRSHICMHRTPPQRSCACMVRKGLWVLCLLWTNNQGVKDTGKETMTRAVRY